MAAITYQFTPASDDALFSKMPTPAFMIHCYGLKRQQITGWKFNKTDICKTLGLSMSTVKKYLKWLREHGYASYERLKFQFTKWQFHPVPITQEQPRSPRIIERSTFDTVEQSTFDTVLIIENTLEKKEQQHEPEPIPENSVVVFSGENLQGTEQEPMPDSDPIPAPEPIPLQDPEPTPAQEPVKEPVVLEYPPQLTPDEINSAKNTIKKCKDAALQPEVLFAFAYYLSRGGVKNPRAYLSGLVRDANNGIFAAIKASDATKDNKPKESSYWQGHKPPEKVDSEAHIQSLAKQYPERSAAINKALPVRCFADFKSNLNLGVAAL